MDNVLITGGTGFFGRNFVKKLLQENVQRICIYSRNEYSQYLMRKEFNDDYRLRYFIGDVRDYDRLNLAMKGIDVVVHAAALKRTEVCEYNIMEAIQTNIIGSGHVTLAAIENNVKKAILVSSDKACNPTTTYGYTKAIAENTFLTSHVYTNNNTKFAVARYGNVANSTGSVIPIFRELLKKQAWLPITDSKCTRYYMTAEQAVDLVYETIESMIGCDLSIPSLPAFNIVDLATAMGAEYTKTIGLPKGEKIHEQMRNGETSETAHRLSIQDLQELIKYL